MAKKKPNTNYMGMECSLEDAFELLNGVSLDLRDSIALIEIASANLQRLELDKKIIAQLEKVRKKLDKLENKREIELKSGKLRKRTFIIEKEYERIKINGFQQILLKKWEKFLKTVDFDKKRVKFFDSIKYEQASLETLVTIIERHEGYYYPEESIFYEEWMSSMSFNFKEFFKENKSKVFTDKEIAVLNSISLSAFKDSYEDYYPIEFNFFVLFDYNVFIRMDEEFGFGELYKNPENENEIKAKNDFIKFAKKHMDGEEVNKLLKSFFKKHNEGESFGGIIIKVKDLLKSIQQQKDIKGATIIGIFDHTYYGDNLYGGGVWDYCSTETTLKFGDFSIYSIDIFIGKGLKTAPFEKDVDVDWKYS